MHQNEFMIPAEHAQTLVDPKAYADGRIHDAHAWLRANNPLGLAAPEGFDPFWVVTKFEDIRAISRDNRLFPSGVRPSTLTDKASEAFIRSITGKPYIGRSLVAMDPPDHMKFRLLTQSWFMPKNLKLLDEQIGRIADATVEKLRQTKGHCDFVVDVALNYPLEVVMEILGVPKEDLPFMLRLTQQAFAPADPESIADGVDANDPAFRAQTLQATFSNLATYFKKITEDRRRTPRNDIATIIATAQIDGAPISDTDALGYYAIIATAGHDTTSSTAAAAMYALANDPVLLRRVKTDPSLIPALIEEAIRWGTPVKTFMRSVAQDTEFQGRSLRKDDWLMLCYASANRDETVFDAGEVFNIDRPKFEHVAFGYGPHLCLGQHMARMELRTLFERLLPAIAWIETDGEAEMSQSYFVNGFKHMPLRFGFEPAPQTAAA